MIRLGKRNSLTVLREVDFGLYLDAGEIGDVLLPRRYVPEGTKEGDVLDVFLYLDAEERLVATTEQPLVEVGQFACLEVSWVNEYGAFLNWGLMKDLFCPFREQKQKMQQGRKYLVYCYIDPITYRIVASAKIEKFLSKERPDYASGDEVEALIQQPTDLGLKAVVDGKYSGLLFHNEIFQPLHVGDRVTAYVKQVRPDGKIDLKLQRHFGKLRVTDFSAQLLDYLRRQPEGYCPLGDKSDADDIYRTFGVSKKTFKRGVGDLYKQRLITIGDDGLRLIEGRDEA
ncbi:MAG: GntR family transcriptional regulator [Bacteroidaceae bacterium]|nr:GntR family transcriptional regulator [Bacteroidaceae bacterium]MDO4994080.1 S1-like domain-containing RNA-binding protein [Bacteroidales bacterium]